MRLVHLGIDRALGRFATCSSQARQSTSLLCNVTGTSCQLLQQRIQKVRMDHRQMVSSLVSGPCSPPEKPACS